MRRYSKEVKEKVLERLRGGESSREVARKLAIPGSTVRGWAIRLAVRSKAPSAPPGIDGSFEELEALIREVEGSLGKVREGLSALRVIRRLEIEKGTLQTQAQVLEAKYELLRSRLVEKNLAASGEGSLNEREKPPS